MNKVYVAGSGSFLPGNPVPASDIEDYIGTLTEAPPRVRRWLERIKPVMAEMLDIDYFHYAIDRETGEFTEDNVTMAVKAARNALDAAGVEAGDVDLIVYGSAHMDQMPTASVRIQEALGIPLCAELGVHANCTSAYKALLLGHDLIRNGRYRNALVISSSMSSSELRADYYNQPLVKKEDLFLRWFLCDGAGALFLRGGDDGETGLELESCYMESAGGEKPSAMGNGRPAYWMNPRQEFEEGRHHLAQLFRDQLREQFHEKGGTIFTHGLKRMIASQQIDIEGLRFFQVNLPAKHISEIVMDECEDLGISRDTFYTKMSRMGYSGPPMVFLCIDRILREENLKPGELVMSFVTEVSKFMQAGFTMRMR